MLYLRWVSKLDQHNLQHKRIFRLTESDVTTLLDKSWRRSQVAQGDGLQNRYFVGSTPTAAFFISTVNR